MNGKDVVVHPDDVPEWPYRQRFRSATGDIAVSWIRAPQEDKRLFARLRDALKQKLPRKFEARWMTVPEELEGKAFIVPHVRPLLFPEADQNMFVTNRLHSVINDAYFRSYTGELDAGVVSDMVYLASDYMSHARAPVVPYRYLLNEFRRRGREAFLGSSSTEELLAFRGSEEWASIYVAAVDARERKKSSIERMRKAVRLEKGEGTAKREAEFGIVTALPTEFASVLKMLEQTTDLRISGDPNNYKTGVIPANNGQGEHVVVVAMQKIMGNNTAATTVSHLLRSFSGIRDVLMVGIAGGMPDVVHPDKHVRLGDVVVSDENGVLQYDRQKLEEGQITIQASSTRPSARLLGMVRQLEAQRLCGVRPWDAHIARGVSVLEGAERPPAQADVLMLGGKRARHPQDPSRIGGLPKVHCGRVGSSNTLLKDETLRNRLRDDHGVRAIEMEASGIVDGTWECAKGYLIIRGIVDYCDGRKGDRWQQYAAVCAAAYARSILEQVPASSPTERI